MSSPLTFAQVGGVGSQQVEDVEVLSYVDENLELRQQGLHLLMVSQIYTHTHTV